MNLCHRRNNEEGASATMFVIVLFMLLAVAMLAVDGGNLYVSQRGQASDTDAAALAGARLLSEDPCAPDAAVTSAADRLLENNTSLIDGAVDVSTAPCTGRGVVTVDTTRDVSFFFAPLFGTDESPTVVRSQAVFGPADVLTGVRPIAICELDLHYQEWAPYYASDFTADDDYDDAVDATDQAYADEGLIAHPSYGGAQDHVHRIYFQRLNADGDPVAGDCSDASGNWGWLDFDSGGNTGYCEDPDTNNELGCRIRQGYEGPISLVQRDCNLDSSSITDCPAQTGGAGNSTRDDLEAVRCAEGRRPTQCEQLMFVVFAAEEANNGGGNNGGGNNGGGNNGGGNNGGGNNGGGNNGGGNNARFELVTVVTAVLRGIGPDVGKGNPDPEEQYFDLEFVTTPLPGQVGGSDPGGTRPTVYQLCGARDFSNCTP